MDPNDKELWKAWLNEHLLILNDCVKNNEEVDDLKISVDKAILSSKFNFTDFKILGNKILTMLPKDEEEDSSIYLHKIENMALLGLTENITLSNSVFEAKRRKILEMDKEGAFLPVATKRIFLKYYSKENTIQYSIWTKDERANYKDDIRKTLKPYLTNSFNNEVEDEN
jgi:hypothetical protein